jgi:hypothetical protein
VKSSSQNLEVLVIEAGFEYSAQYLRSIEVVGKGTAK